MLTLQEEYDQWLSNYKNLLEQLKAAYRFKNKKAIQELYSRILSTQVQIATLSLALKKQSDADSSNTVSATVSSDVKVSKDSSVNFKSISGDGSE